MAKVNVEPDCGNAPKKLFLRDFIIALSNQDAAFILDNMADNVQWQMVGGRSFHSKSAVAEALEDMMAANIDEVTIASIITHGNEGSVSGTMAMADGKHYGFCHVVMFSSHGKDAKLKHITSYRIEQG